MSHRSFFTFIVAACLFSCQSRINHNLNLAETMMQDRPDSALYLLNNIETNELQTRKLRARHALLTSMALDKNYIDIADDSIINCAVDYYSEKGTSEEKMKAWYYQGIVQKNASDYTASVVSMEMAENEAQKNLDYHTLGLIYRNKSDIFNTTNNYDAAILYIKKAIESFESCADSIYALYAKYSLAVAYLNNKATRESYGQLQEILQNPLTNSSLRTQSELCLARVFVEEGDSLEKAISIYRKTPERLYIVLDYGLYAIALYRSGQRDSVQHWFDKGYRRFNHPEMTALLQYLQSTIAYKDKDYQLAFQLEDNALHVQDSLTRVLLHQSLSNAQRDYYHARMLLGEEMVKRQKAGIVCGCIVVLLILTIVFLAGRQKRQKADAIIKEQMIKLSLDRNSTIQANAYLIGALEKERISHLHHLSEDYYQEDDPQKKEKAFLQFKQSLREIREDKAFFDSLEADLNKYCNGLMKRLVSQVPRIKGQNRKLIALLFSGLPGEWIQVLGYKNSSGSIKTSRSRFRDIIKEAHPVDEDIFLEMLEAKKQLRGKTK